MTGFSKVLNASKAVVGRFNLFRASQMNTQVASQAIRESHGRAMFIRPGKFYTKKYMDLLHFQFCLSALPFALIIGYQYLFKGPATLAEIPEGYEPRHWEYYKNPVSRFLAQNVFEVPERSYEEHLHFVYREQCKQKMRALEAKVRDMMQQKQDYKAWYYIPVNKEGREQKEQFNKDFGSQGYDSKFASSEKK